MSNLQRDFEILKVMMASFGVDVSKVFIAGGSIRDHLMGKPYKDIDIYTEEEYSFQLVRLYKNFGKVTLISESATTFEINGVSTPIQIIHKIEGSPEEVIKQFDFTINAKYLKFSDTFDKIVTNDHWSLILCENVLTPNTLLERMMKFIKMGYSIQQEQFIKVLEQVKNANSNFPRLSSVHLSGFYGTKE